jgi:hypothetical protein
MGTRARGHGSGFRHAACLRLCCRQAEGTAVAVLTTGAVRAALALHAYEIAFWDALADGLD